MAHRRSRHSPKEQVGAGVPGRGGRAGPVSLGSGGWLCFCPCFPRWIERPGFWDPVSVFNASLEPVFSWALFDKEGEEIPLRFRERSRTADALILSFEARCLDGEILWVQERREVDPGDRVSSRIQVDGPSGRSLSCLAFTWHPGEVPSVWIRRGRFLLRRELRDHRFPPVPVEIRFGGSGFRPLEPRWVEGSPRGPGFVETPWFDSRTPYAREGEFRAPEALPSRSSLQLACRAGGRVGAGKPLVFRVGCGLRLRLPSSGWPSLVLAPSRFKEFRNRFPTLECEDPRYMEVFEQRIRLLHLMRLPGGKGLLPGASICEGEGFFREPVSYSAHALAREARWMSDPRLARGLLGNFLRAMEPSGRIPGRLYLTSLEGADFYFADWAGACEGFLALHPRRPRFLLGALGRYAGWLFRDRDAEESGLIDVLNQYETGQEFSSRYQGVDPLADREDRVDSFRMCGVDATVYAWRILELLARETGGGRGRLRRTGEALLGCWNEGQGFFLDRDPVRERPVPARPATGFYPLLTRLPGEGMVLRLLEALEDPGDFGTPFPLPSLSLRDPLFDPDARWKGVRRVCPWNGRVWPMINSHIIEALCLTGDRKELQEELRRRALGLAAWILDRSVELFSGRIEGLQSHEHYHPFTGRASRYRGVDHYLHCWILDNILSVICGLAPERRGLRIRQAGIPLPDFRLRLPRIRGRLIEIRREKGRLKVGRGRDAPPGEDLFLPWKT